MGGTVQSPSGQPSSYGGGGASWGGGMQGTSMPTNMPMQPGGSMGSAAQFDAMGAQSPISSRPPGFSGPSGGGVTTPISPAPGSPAGGSSIGSGHGGPGSNPPPVPNPGGPGGGGGGTSTAPNQNTSLLGGAINTPYWQSQYASNPSGVQAMFSPPAYNQLSQFYPGLQQSSGPQAAGSNPLQSMFQSGQLGK